MTTCCPESAPTCTWRWPRRWRPARPRTPPASLELSAGIAAHYSAAGDQPAALRASVAAALTARRVHAAAESARLAERALQLWARVPDPEALTGMSHMALVLLAGRALLLSGDYARAEQLLTSVLDDLGPDTDPGCHAELLGVLAHVQWMLNRGLQGIETAKRALDSLPQDAGGGCERAELLDWLARAHVPARALPRGHEPTPSRRSLRRGRPATRPARPGRSTRWGWLRSCSATSSRALRACVRRSRCASARTTSTEPPTVTPTWPTCSRSRGAPPRACRPLATASRRSRATCGPATTG